MSHYVYKITNLKTGKVYIGKTSVGVAHRFQVHKSSAFSPNKKARDSCPKLYRAIRKYGVENFTIETVGEYETEEKALDKEAEYIQHFNSIETGMNTTLGGNHPTAGKYNSMFGQGDKIRGEKNGMFGKTGAKNPFFGKRHPPEMKQKRSLELSTFSEKELAAIKLMLANGKSTTAIKRKYPAATDKILSLLRSGKRWGYIRSDLIIPPVRRPQITTEQANKLREEFATGKYASKKAFFDAIRSEIEIGHTTLINILNNKIYKT